MSLFYNSSRQGIMASHRIRWVQRFALLLLAVMVMAEPATGWAQAAGANNNLQNMTCTNFKESKEYAFGAAGSGADTKPGILSEIYTYIKDIVGDATKNLFETFTESSAYQAAVAGALTLTIVFFGVGFTIGVVQASFGQVLIRLIKIGIIVTLISPGGWQFFSDYMVRFFMDGTDDLVKGVVAIGTGVESLPPDATPFYQFDKLAEFIIKPDTIIAIMGSAFAGGPYGLTVSGLMVLAFWGFLKLLIDALRLYAIAFVARSLLLGLAPIFFIFLLFDRTKNLFMSWVNALINVSLQPIMMFTFLAFFMVLIETASKDMLGREFCWTVKTGAEGTSNQYAFWSPVDKNNSPITSSMTWGGSMQCLISGSGDCEEFPINIIDILTFLLLVHLAQRFAGTIERITSELSNAFITLDMGGKLDQFLAQQGRTGLSGILPGNKPK